MNFNDFTGLYSLSKTLRFEAKPVGATWYHIQQSELLNEDQHRAESYKVVKKLIDEYHKAFIDKVMDSFCLPLASQGKLNSLQEYHEQGKERTGEKTIRTNTSQPAQGHLPSPTKKRGLQADRQERTHRERSGSLCLSARPPTA